MARPTRSSTVAQTLATRAFRALQKLALGKANRVRFKNKSGLDSIEEKSDTGFRWKKTGVQFKKLFMPAIIAPEDPVHAYALTKKVKYVRILRRRIRGKLRYFAQLVLSGRPLSLRERFVLKGKNESCLPKISGTVGLDIGPSTVAIVSEEAASLHVFCGELQPNARNERQLQRKQDRQRRAANPLNFDPKGRALKGRRTWVKTKGYQRTSAKIANEQRRTAAHRKSLHGALINQHVPLGKILMEKISIRSFQKNFGRSVGIRAPGMFIERLKRKAENACGSVEECSTFATCLSQMCICGTRQKNLCPKECIHASAAHRLSGIYLRPILRALCRMVSFVWLKPKRPGKVLNHSFMRHTRHHLTLRVEGLALPASARNRRRGSPLKKRGRSHEIRAWMM